MGKFSQSMRKAKHIEIRYHFSRECMEPGQTTYMKIDSSQNCADTLTKPLYAVKFNAFCDMIGVVSENDLTERHQED